MSRRTFAIRVVLIWLFIACVGISTQAQLGLPAPILEPEPVLDPTPAPTTEPAPTAPTPTPEPTAAPAPVLTLPALQLDKLDPLLQQAVSEDPDGRSQVVVRAQDIGSLAAVVTLLETLGGATGRHLSLIEAVAAEIPNSALGTLSNDAAVRRIAADRPMFGAMQRTRVTTGAGAARWILGYDGTGVGVAVIDSGVTAWHDDLGDGQGSQRVDQFVDFVNGRTGPYDDFGHGTHVAGIIAGNGFDSNGAQTGIAPGARLVVLKVLDAAGRGRMSDVIAAFEHVVTHKDAFGIRVVNVSVATGVYESYYSDFLTLAAKRAVDAGLIVVAAAGNNGRRDGLRQYASITAPGNAPWVLTVGASSHGGTTARYDDTIATFSSRGPTAVDFTAKPDLVAPGVGIQSLSDPLSAMYVSRSSSLREGTVATTYLPYLSLTGTSQATPVVTGTVALMLQANPALTPNAVKAILQYSAQTYLYDALTQGAGFLNAYGAVELARFFSAPSLYSWPNSIGWSGQLVWGNHRVSGGLLLPQANAWLPDVEWGAARDGEESIYWGLRPSISETGDVEWSAWGTSCADPECDSIIWGTSESYNVVWGSVCGGDDCADASSGDRHAWSTSMDETIVWGTNDEQTIVWGTTGEDTIVWGTSDEDTIVWGTTCDDPDCNQ
jgi:serine protease AprX